MKTTLKTVADFEIDLKAAAAKCGVSLDGLTVKWCHLDSTWGDSYGWVFFGEHAERAAKFCSAWAKKHLDPQSTYNAQRHADAPRACEVAIGNNGVYTNRESVWGADDLDWRPGFKVSVVYYPCAE
jgi:hypothetical protein